MSKTLIAYTASLLLIASPLRVVYAAPASTEAYEHRRVAKINIQMETLRPGQAFNPDIVLRKMKTKSGDPFFQLTFDQDLKTLSEEYDRAEPSIDTRNGELYITIKIWQKPVIRAIKWDGNKRMSTRKLQGELDIKPNTTFNRDEFNKAFNKVKEYYIKRGYFESHLQYTLAPNSEDNSVDVIISVYEGRSGHIESIEFEGFTKGEESDILSMINTKKYSLLTSWLKGTGIYHEEALDHDRLVVVDYLQNQGYADAKVNISVRDSEKTGEIIITIKATRGEIYKFGDVSFTGNKLYTDAEIEKGLQLKEGDLYSPDKLRDSIQSLRDLYGKKGYIDTNIQYTLDLSLNRPIYNVRFTIEENDQYRVGMIRVLGNTNTQTNVVLRESLLVPGEVFDSRRLKATEQRLQATGYFKSVNVYAVRATDDDSLGESYRDVVIEVEETTTGSMSLFFGFSTLNQLFGGLDLTENNFNYKGLGTFWKEGLSAIRGGGEFAHARLSIGAKEQTYSISWLDPYFRDTLWRIGFDVTYNKSSMQSSDYNVDTIGGALYANYPITPYWTYGFKYRIRNAIIHIAPAAGPEAFEQEKNSGLVNGLSGNLSYDSTNSSYKPSRGIRSALEAEIAGVHRHASKNSDFPFAKFSFVNAFYHPIWKKATFKARAELRYVYPFGDGNAELLPISERFFLGGETTVRGYRSFSIGPKFQKVVNGQLQNTDDPIGGISSTLVSFEILQNIYKPIDAFVFFDGGAISLDDFDIGKFKMAYGVGLRLEIGPRLPLMVGMGWPINPDSSSEVQRFFFSMGTQF